VSPITADEVCARVSVLLTTPDDAERAAAASWLLSWQSSPSSCDVALRLVRQSFNQSVVFWATKALETHLAASPDCMDDIFLAMRTRAQSELCPPDAKCLAAFLRCLALASLLRPAYVDGWADFRPDLQVPYLAALFDGSAERGERPRVLTSLVRTAVFPLLATAPMTRDWLRLARHAIRFLTDDYSLFDMLSGRFLTIPEHRETFSEFVDFCADLHSEDFLNASDGDRQFIGRTMEVLLDVADRLLDGDCDVCEVQMAALIFEDVFDYSDDFLLAWRPFAGRAVGQLNAAIGKLCSEPPDFMQLVEVVGPQLANLARHADDEFWEHIGRFLSALMQLIDTDFGVWKCASFHAAFFQLSIGASPRLTRFYEDLGRNPTPGLVYAVACSELAVKRMFGPPLLDYAMSVPAALSFFFIGECAAVLEQDALAVVFDQLDGCDEAVAEAVMEITRQRNVTRIDLVVAALPSVEPPVLAKLVGALLNVPGTEAVVHKAVSETVRRLAGGEEVFSFIGGLLVVFDIDLHRKSCLCELFDGIVAGLGRL
jgi:hypothetical protein